MVRFEAKDVTSTSFFVVRTLRLRDEDSLINGDRSAGISWYVHRWNVDETINQIQPIYLHASNECQILYLTMISLLLHLFLFSTRKL